MGVQAQEKERILFIGTVSLFLLELSLVDGANGS
jgi:hypothetical protein